MTPTWETVRAWIEQHVRRDTASGCWLWTRPLSRSGYGRLFGRGAHCLSYEAHVGPIPRGLDIDHLCRNRGCVNPLHLEPVTRRENLARGIGASVTRARRAAKLACVHGHRLDADNIYTRPSDGARCCRVCKRAHDARMREKHREKINRRKREKRKQQEKIA